MLLKKEERSGLRRDKEKRLGTKTKDTTNSQNARGYGKGRGGKAVMRWRNRRHERLNKHLRQEQAQTFVWNGEEEDGDW